MLTFDTPHSPTDKVSERLKHTLLRFLGREDRLFLSHEELRWIAVDDEEHTLSTCEVAVSFRLASLRATPAMMPPLVRFLSGESFRGFDPINSSLDVLQSAFSNLRNTVRFLDALLRIRRPLLALTREHQPSNGSEMRARFPFIDFSVDLNHLDLYPVL